MNKVSSFLVLLNGGPGKTVCCVNELSPDCDTLLILKLSALVSGQVLLISTCVCRTNQRHELQSLYLNRVFIPSHTHFRSRLVCLYLYMCISVFAVVIGIACSSFVRFVKQIISSCNSYYIISMQFRFLCL